MTESAVSGESQNTDSAGKVTQEMLQQLREENAGLVVQISESQRSKAEREAQHAIDIEYGQLLTENVRLRRELASAEAAEEATQVSAASDNLLSTIRENLQTAVTQAAAPVGPVDTNSGFVEPEENLPSAADQKAAEEGEQQDVLPDQPAVTDSTSPTASTPTGVDVDAPTPVSPEVPTEAESQVEVPEAVSDFLSPSTPEVPTAPTDLGDADGSNQNEE